MNLVLEHMKQATFYTYVFFFILVFHSHRVFSHRLSIDYIYKKFSLDATKKPLPSFSQLHLYRKNYECIQSYIIAKKIIHDRFQNPWNFMPFISHDSLHDAFINVYNSRVRFENNRFSEYEKDRYMKNLFFLKNEMLYWYGEEKGENFFFRLADDELLYSLGLLIVDFNYIKAYYHTSEKNVAVISYIEEVYSHYDESSLSKKCARCNKHRCLFDACKQLAFCNTSLTTG